MAKLIGSAPSQVPTNGDLGSMAFEDKKNYATTSSPIYQPYRNIIINGDMSIAQRGTSTASITSTGYYTVDRFNTSISSLGTWTQSQSTDVPTGQGFANSFKLDCTTANATPAALAILRILQRFEGQNLQYLKKGTANAVPLTLSFWVKSTKTGTFIAELFDTDNTRQISKSYTVDVTNTWEKKTITFEGDTTGVLGNDNGNSLQIAFWLAAGSAYTSGTLSDTWSSVTSANRAVGQVNIADSTSNDFYITGVQLEAGTTASDFEFLPHDVNFDRCVRYYYQWGGLDAYETLFMGSWLTSSDCYMKLEYLKEMRAAPSFSKVGNWMDLTSGGTLGATANTGHVTRRAIQIQWASGSGGVIGRSGLIRANNDLTARIKVDAEL